jgi:hypothetical protein
MVGKPDRNASAFYVGEPDVGVASPIGETRIRKIQNPHSPLPIGSLMANFIQPSLLVTSISPFNWTTNF